RRSNATIIVLMPTGVRCYRRTRKRRRRPRPFEFWSASGARPRMEPLLYPRSKGDPAMRSHRVWALFTVLAIAVGSTTSVAAQQTPEPTRREIIEQAQAEKVKSLHPYELTRGERLMNKVEDLIVNGGLHWHQFFESANHGAGFTLGAGYMHHVSPYNLLDVRGSYSILGYQLLEAEFIAPRIFHRRGQLSVLGG